MSNKSSPTLPLTGIRIIEFGHMVMGPTCGMVLADLGADVIKVEPPGGDKTRQLPGLGMGFFRAFNRNKKSVVLDLHTAEGHASALELIASADAVIENFRPGLMASLKLDHASLSCKHPELIYVSHKGFLAGPYEHRLALDEVVQMMGGLAYMTGPVGRPLRAGSSVNDIMGGMFGALGLIAALYQRKSTGLGQEIQSALFENCVLLSSQHMQQFAISGTPPPPIPSRTAAWGVYDVFKVANDQQLFIGAVSEKQWISLCRVLSRQDLLGDARFLTNTLRVQNRPALLETLGTTLEVMEIESISAALENAQLPYAPIRSPDQLMEDPHLLESGGLVPIINEDGQEGRTVLLPITLNGHRPGVRLPLAAIGQHTDEILASLRGKNIRETGPVRG